MKKVLSTFICLYSLASCYCQTYNCEFITTYESEPKLKSSNSVISIGEKEISVSNFLSGGTKTLKLAVDSVANKDYNFHDATWYYCHSERKDIVVVSKQIKKVYVFDFADEVTIFQYSFSYK